MEIRTFIIRVVTKYSGKGAAEAEADLDKLGQTTKRSTRGLSDHQKAQRAAREEAKKLAKAERDAAKALKEQARAAEKATRENQKLARANAKRLAQGFAKRDRAAAVALKEQARAAAQATRASTNALKEEARAAAQAARASTNALKEEARAADKATRSAEKLANAQARASQKAFAGRKREAASAIRNQARATAKATRETERFAKATVTAAVATARMATKQQKAAEQAEKLAEAEAKVARETREAAAEARKASSSWTAIAGEFAAVGGAATAVGIAIAAVALPVLLVGSKFESLRAQLDNLLGSAEAGENAFAFVQSFATKTPFQLDEVTSSFVKLQGRGIKPTEERLTSLGDIAAANGKTFDDITEAALDATQGEGERLKEFGIRMKTVGETVSLSFRGTTISVNKNQEAITDALTQLGQLEGVAGSMSAQMNTLKGQFSNAKDALDQFLNTAAQSGPLKRTGELLGDLRDKFLDPTNARLLGETLDEVFKIIQEALAEVEPETIIDGFKLLLNVLKILGVVLKPFIALWNQAVGLIERGERATAIILKLASAVSVFTKALFDGTLTLQDLKDIGNDAAAVVGRLANAVSGFATDAITAREAGTEIARTFDLIDEAADTAALGMDNLRAKAIGAIEAVKAAVTGSFVESATKEELLAILANEDAPASIRNSATKELSNRKNRGGKAKADAARREDKFRKERGEARSEFLGKKGKGKKGSQFFDFEQQAEAAANKLGEEFAAAELERLLDGATAFEAQPLLGDLLGDTSALASSQGLSPREAQAQARAAGKKRAAEKKAEFIKAGRIGESDGILDQLGLRGPGSVLKNRPAPATLLITISPIITFIENFTQSISGGPAARSLEAAAGEGGRAAIEAGLEPHRKMFEEIVMTVFNLQADRLQKAEGGGTLPSGPQG